MTIAGGTRSLQLPKQFFSSVFSKQFCFRYQRMNLGLLADRASVLLLGYIYQATLFTFIFYFETGSYQVAQTGLELIV